jgi:hypothetical protein
MAWFLHEQMADVFLRQPRNHTNYLNHYSTSNVPKLKSN